MLPRLISRSPLRSLARGYATRLKGRADILAKRSDDVVITFAKRTALGRAKKGQLKDVPVDELLHALFKVLATYDRLVDTGIYEFVRPPSRRPSLTPRCSRTFASVSSSADPRIGVQMLMWPLGTCHPPSPLYLSRAAAIAAGVPAEVPISTVNRLCSSGLQSIVHVSNAIRGGQIEVGMAVGVESMSLK